MAETLPETRVPETAPPATALPAETVPQAAPATAQETVQTVPQAPATAQETAQTATQDKSPGITNELQRTIEFLTSIKDKQEEFKKTKDEPKKKQLEQLEDDLIKIMNDFNQTIEDLFINLNLDNDKLSHARSPSPLKTGKGVGEPQSPAGAPAEAGAPGPEAGAPAEAAMGGNKSKTQKKQSKNKNKNKTQKRH